MASVDKYIQGCDRGDFHWYPLETDDYFGAVLKEICSYKGKEVGTKVSKISSNEYEVEVDLNNDPYYIVDTRSSRNLARTFAERIIVNDANGEYKKNKKYVD